jgi:hypothetical protein
MDGGMDGVTGGVTGGRMRGGLGSGGITPSTEGGMGARLAPDGKAESANEGRGDATGAAIELSDRDSSAGLGAGSGADSGAGSDSASGSAIVAVAAGDDAIVA